MFNKLAKDAFFTLSTSIINTAMGFITSIIISRLLGPEQQGTLKIILMLPTLLYTFLNLGLESAVMYYGSREKNCKTISRVTNKFSLVFFAVAMIVGTAAIFLGSQVFDYYKGIAFVYLASILLMAPANFYIAMQSALLRSENDFVRYNIFNTIKQVTYVIGILFVFLYRSIWVVIGANYLMIFVGVLLCRFGMHHKDTDATRPYGRDLLKYGMKSYVSSVINFFNYRFDIVLLTPQVSKAQVGIYSVAQTLSEMIWMIPNSVSQVLLPRISAMNVAEKRAAALRVCRYVASIMIVVVAIGFVVTPVVLPLLYGTKYLGSILPFRILLIGTFFMTYNRILGNAIAAHGRPEKNISSNIVGSAANVILNIFLIPRYGIIGAAIAGSISYSLSGFASMYIYMRLNPGTIKLMDILIMNKSDMQSMIRLAKRKLKAGK
jgi:O-antigen/teichoic acid export membrane protein